MPKFGKKPYNRNHSRRRLNNARQTFGGDIPKGEPRKPHQPTRNKDDTPPKKWVMAKKARGGSAMFREY